MATRLEDTVPDYSVRNKGHRGGSRLLYIGLGALWLLVLILGLWIERHMTTIVQTTVNYHNLLLQDLSVDPNTEVIGTQQQKGSGGSW